MVQRQRRYDGTLRHLASMRAFLREVCQETWQAEPADERLILQLELALTEAASNIILHGLEGQPQPSILVTVDINDDQSQRDASVPRQVVRPPSGAGTRL